MIMQDDELSPESMQRIGDFMLPNDQAALTLLERYGPDAIRQTVVLWGVLHANPTPEADREPGSLPYSHYINIEWLELGTDVTGFYFKMKNGKDYDFSNSIDPNSEHFAELAIGGPGRYELLYFSNATGIPAKQLIQWPAGLHDKVIVKRHVKEIGLILRDGTKTKPGPFGYFIDRKVKKHEGSLKTVEPKNPDNQ